MKRLNLLMLILAIFLILSNNTNVYSQVYDSTRQIVELPLKKYKAIRYKLIYQDSLIFNLKSISNFNDSLLKETKLKELSYIKEINNKSNTIDTLYREYNKISKEYTKEKKSILTSYKSWAGLAIGLTLGIFIMK